MSARVHAWLMRVEQPRAISVNVRAANLYFLVSRCI